MKGLNYPRLGWKFINVELHTSRDSAKQFDVRGVALKPGGGENLAALCLEINWVILQESEIFENRFEPPWALISSSLAKGIV